MKLNSSIPKRLPDGRTNPDYSKAYNKARKEAGNPVKQYPKDAAYWREYRKTEAGKAAMKKRNSGENGKAATARYEEKMKLKRRTISAAKKAAKIANELLALTEE